MVSAEIIAIGTELLLGEILDTNTPFLLKELNKLGIDIFRTIIVGDNPERISEQILQSIKSADIVITTGGLGPTVDDPTREAVANAFDDKLIFSESLWDQINERFKKFNRQPTDNNRRQAYIPQKAIAIKNTVGTAPAFYIQHNRKAVFSLPGVPAEVIHIFNTECIQIIKDLFSINYTTFSKIIHTAGIGESSLDTLVGEFEKLSNPTVGLTAKPGQVNIRITAKAKNNLAAKKMIEPIEADIVQLLKDYVYGYDDDTLLQTVELLLTKTNKKLHLIHSHTPPQILKRLIKLNIFASIEKLDRVDNHGIKNIASMYNKTNKNNCVVLLEFDESNNSYKISFDPSDITTVKDFHFGGHDDLFENWVENNLLNAIRQELMKR